VVVTVMVVVMVLVLVLKTFDNDGACAWAYIICPYSCPLISPPPRVRTPDSGHAVHVCICQTA
jgi:hypothetical protein